MGKWIGFITDKNYNCLDKNQDYGMPSAYIIKDFDIFSNKKINIKIACLGVYSLYINGSLINDTFMESDVTEMSKKVYSRTYDISKYLIAGTKNRVGIVLGDGWYASNLSIVHKNVFGEYPLKVKFEIYQGSRIIAESDGTELAKDGSIRASDNQNGIIIDNNYKIKHFSTFEMELLNFKPVSCYDIFVEEVNDPLPPITKHEVFKGKLLTKKDNYYIFDFGQNMAGVVHAKIKGSKGSYVEFLHSEIIIDDDIFIDNLRTAKAKDTFILSGVDVEEFLPRFTFHGFRYVKAIIHGDITFVDIEAYALYTNLKQTGYFSCDNKLINQIYSNVLWGQKSNFFSIPTDCPQRDERMGWTGDAQIFSKTACYNFDSLVFYKSYLHSIRDSMDLYSDLIPAFVPNFFRKREPMLGCPGWSDAIIIIPYNLYLFYGDKNVLIDNLPYMKRFLSYVENNCLDSSGKYCSHSFGDWLSVFENTDVDFYNAAYIAYDMYLLSEICKVLGDKDCTIYENKFSKMKEEVINNFVSKNGIVANDTQGSYILANSLHILSKEEVANNLVRKVKQYNHLTTGFHSTKGLLSLLCDINEPDLAYKLINNKEYPSWGYMIECGATTIWERWDSYRKDIGINSDGMNSFNHYSLGSVGEWIYEYLVGIKPTIENPGFKKILVKPYFNKSIMNMSCVFDSPNGKISVDYKIVNGSVSYKFKCSKNVEPIFDFIEPIISKKIVDINEYEFVLKL